MEHVTSPKAPLALSAADTLANSPFRPISMYNTYSPSNFQLVANFSQVWQTKDLKDVKFLEFL